MYTGQSHCPSDCAGYIIMHWPHPLPSACSSLMSEKHTKDSFTQVGSLIVLRLPPTVYARALHPHICTCVEHIHTEAELMGEGYVFGMHVGVQDT